MASTSAHFNLTKPATTDYYNIGVFNDNTDIIDTQMYNNQVSAAKIMVGATANDDGESGRVPVPHAGDQDKYLCADGTWKPVQGGGGGSTVTITPTLSSGTKIADYSIDGVSDSLYAPNGGGGGGIDYSTTEQDTGLKWIDGSTIYQKTFLLQNISSSYSSVDLGMTSASVDLMWIHEGFAYTSTYSSGTIMPYTSSGAAGEFGFIATITKANTNIQLDYRAGTYVEGGNAYITVRYTKASS